MELNSSNLGGRSRTGPKNLWPSFHMGRSAFEGTDGFKLIKGTTIARYREWPKVCSVEGYHGLTRSSEQHRDPS